MSKAKQNTFLIGYFSVLAIGAAGLGYLAWSSASASSEAQEEYETTTKKLSALQKAPIFPNQDNVDAKKKQVDAYTSKVDELAAALKSHQAPLNEEMTNDKFQSKLQTVRDGLVQEAKDSGVKLPDNYDLGFGTYLSTFPESTAVSRLDAFVDGISFVVKSLYAAGVKEINSLSRPEMSFERKEAAPKPDEAAKGKAKPAAKKPAGKDKTEAEPAPALAESAALERFPFEITFTGSSRAVNNFLTTIANSASTADAPYFYNIRTLRIENEQKKGAEVSAPVRLEEATDPVTGKPYKRDSIYIFGVESVQVHLGLELIRFTDAAATEAKK